jgi:hypothetical protein
MSLFWHERSTQRFRSMFVPPAQGATVASHADRFSIRRSRSTVDFSPSK